MSTDDGQELQEILASKPFFRVGHEGKIASNAGYRLAKEAITLSATNPYAFNPIDVRPDAPDDHPDFGRVLLALKETRPWVRLLGYTLIFAAIMSFFAGRWVYAGFLQFGAVRANSFRILMLTSWGFAIVGYIAIGLQLLSYASLIHKAEVQLSMIAVAAAAEKQRTLWKYAALFVVSTLILSGLPMLIVLLQYLLA